MPVQEWSDRIWVVSLVDEPGFSDELRPLVDGLRDRDQLPGIILDLGDVTQINSSNLSQLLRLRKVMTERDALLRLTGVTDAVWSVFIMTGLDKVFHFAEDKAMALAELQIAQ